jgi:hypothetical protein
MTEQIIYALSMTLMVWAIAYLCDKFFGWIEE